MNREQSVYLDLIRFSMAFIVFLSHLAMGNVGGGLFHFMAPFGTPAVIVFFVLSGYVIAFVTASRETRARDYIIARCARLYSVVVPTIALTALLDWGAARLDPGLYSQFELLTGNGVLNLPICLLFLNSLWDLNIFPGSNGAYWSLGYEAVYYVIFGAAFYLRGAVRVVTCGLLIAAAGPTVILFFPVWLAGWLAYHVTAQRHVSRRGGWFLFIGSATAALVLIVWSLSHGFLRTQVNLTHHYGAGVAQDYILTMLTTMNLIGFGAIGDRFSGAIRIVGPSIRWLAGATFTVYLLHVPLILFVRAATPLNHTTKLYDVLLIGLPLIGAFLVASVTERKKAIWTNFFDRALRRALADAPAR